MKLQTALALFIWGSNYTNGNAFTAASQPSSITFQTKSPIKSLPFGTKNIARGGGAGADADAGAGAELQSKTTLHSSTVDDVEVCPDSVSQYVSSDNWSLLSARGKQALANVINGDDGIGAQEHVYKEWPEAGVNDEEKIKLTEQVR